MEPLISFKNFTFKYNAQSEPTLKNINLTIEKGQKVLIIGPSGCGKPALGHCLNGIFPNIYQGDKGGDFFIDGKDAFDLSVYDKSHLVSTVLQDPDGQFIGLTVAEDLAFALENDCVEQDDMVKRVTNWAEKLDLLDLLNHRPQDLSGGQKQRVSLAGVLIDESPILLLDEPLANLDPKSGQDIIDLVDKIHREEKTTTIIIEHRLEDVLYRHVDKIILINDGQILFDGSPDKLLQGQLLVENGIREPLYISVLRELDLDVSQTEHLSSLEEMDVTGIKFLETDKEIIESSKEKLLEIKDLCFAYRPERQILKNISLKIFKGEKISIVGKNGAGKSTLAKALCQFVRPTGDILYKGQSILEDSIKERAEKIGYVLQNPNQMISQTMIFDEVALGLRLRGVADNEVERRVLETLKICGLHEFRKWPVSALSFGQKKRVTIASILVLNPEIIILDEPTAGQDKRNYTEIMKFLDELNAAGNTIIMITHDMQLMMEYSDRSIVVSDGQILSDTTPVELFAQNAILNQANLKKTSIFNLADKIQADPSTLTKYYIEQQGGSHV